MRKNVAGQKIGAQLISATDGSAFTGAVTVYVTIDAGTQAIGTVGSGAATHEGNGYHTYAPSQAETNGDLVAFTFVGTGAISATVQASTSGDLTTASVEAIADAVYDEPYAGHTTAGTYGKLWDLWRKGNPSVGGEVTSAITPTKLTFSTNLTGYPNGAFKHAVLLFVAGSTNSESNSPIVGYVASNGVITLEEEMPQVVSVGDEFVIAANSHVHSIAAIAAGVWGATASGYSAATTTLGYIVYALGQMIESVAGVFRYKTSALTGGGGSGQYAITLVASSSGGNVPGTKFSIVGTAINVTTGSSGTAVVNLDAGTYTLRTTPPVSYQTVADSSLVVAADATETKTLTLIPLVPVEIQSAPSATLALRPAMDRRTPPLTLAGVVDHLLLLDEINPAEPRSVDRAVKAARDSLSSFASYSTQGFKYYESRAKIVMPGTFSLGTITVSNGSFTLPGTVTIPSWAPLAHVRVDRNTNKVYPVLLVNGQTITVDTLPNGTYSNVYLEQLFFALPRNFRRRGVLSDSKNSYTVEDMSGGALQSLQDFYRWVGFSEFGRRFSAITLDQRSQGDLMIAVWPPYENREELSIFFERYPEVLKHHRVGNSAATLSVTGVTATSSHAIFNSSHVGASLTIGLNSDQELLKSLSSESLVDTQRIIRYVSSPTSAVLDVALPASVSSRAFYISDIVDVQPGVMTEAYKRLAEYELLRQSKGAKADQKLREFISALQMAQTDDTRYKASVDQYNTPVGGVQWGSVNTRPN